MSHYRKSTFREIWERRYAFLIVSMLVLFLTYSFLYAIDFVPEPIVENPTVVPVATTTPTKPTPTKPVVAVDPLPVRMTIEALDRDIKILNPKNDDVDTLNDALLSGVVRHPDSADFKKKGTMVLLGHSSYLPTVHNRNFQAFNGIQKLEWGDHIKLQSGDTEYVYRVKNVRAEKASTGDVPIQWDKPMLILVTCNVFGQKDDRYIVEAMFVESHPLPAPSGR